MRKLAADATTALLDYNRRNKGHEVGFDIIAGTDCVDVRLPDSHGRPVCSYRLTGDGLSCRYERPEKMGRKAVEVFMELRKAAGGRDAE